MEGDVNSHPAWLELALQGSSQMLPLLGSFVQILKRALMPGSLILSSLLSLATSSWDTVVNQ